MVVDVISKLVSFLCCLLVITNFITQACAQPLDMHFCNPNKDGGNYTSNSTYHSNLNILLSTLTSNAEIKYGFYNLSYGENSEKVYGIGLCRGDIKADKCGSCLNNARVKLTQVCPNEKEAIGWYEDETCMLRYSNRSIFGVNAIGPAYYVWNKKNATDTDKFNKDVINLLNSLTSKAAAASGRKYATGIAPVGPNNETIYGLVQCTPDLSGPDCTSCLNQSIAVIPSCCNNKIGARVVRPSCHMRYETSFPFYEAAATTYNAPSPSPTPDAPPLSLPPSPTSQGISNKSRTAIAFFFLFLCSFLSTS